ERLGSGGIDQGHRPLDEPLFCKKRLLGVGDDIDNSIADAEDIEAGLRHLWLWPGREETAGDYRGLSFPGKTLTIPRGRVLILMADSAVLACLRHVPAAAKLPRRMRRATSPSPQTRHRSR